MRRGGLYVSQCWVHNIITHQNWYVECIYFLTSLTKPYLVRFYDQKQQYSGTAVPTIDCQQSLFLVSPLIGSVTLVVGWLGRSARSLITIIFQIRYPYVSVETLESKLLNALMYRRYCWSWFRVVELLWWWMYSYKLKLESIIYHQSILL